MKIISLRPKLKLDPYSQPDPRQKSSTSDYWVATAGLLLVGFGSMLAGLLLYIDSNTAAQVALPSDSWHVSFAPLTNSCRSDSMIGDDCLASPNATTLWQSPILRGSAEFLDHFSHGDKLSYWVGAKVPPAVLKQAAHDGANIFILPKIHGTVDVWLDGVYQMRYSAKDQRLPLQLTLSSSRLNEGLDMTVALRVLPYPSYFNPDSSALATSEGFLTAVEADRIARYTVFFSLTRYLIATGLFLLLAGILWSVSFANRTSHDYVVGAQFALLIALNSLVSMDLSARVLNVAAFHSFYFLLLFWEAVFALRLTLAILRVSRRLTLRQSLILLGASVAVTALTPQTWIWSTGLSWMTSAVLPLVYAACSFALGRRVYQLRKIAGPASRDRFEFLGMTSVTMGLTAIAYAAEAFHTSGFDVSWSRWLNFTTLYLLVRLFTRGHQAKVSLIESIPVSRFHRMTVLPESVEGWVMHLEVLKFGSDHQVMNTVLSHLWSVVQLHGGEVIRTEANTIVALFEEELDSSESTSLIRAISDMAKTLRDLEKRFQIILPDGSFTASILFRAAVVRGSVRPAWKVGEHAASTIPTWYEVPVAGGVGVGGVAGVAAGGAAGGRPAGAGVGAGATPGTVAAGTAAKALLEVDLDAALRSSDVSLVVMREDEGQHLEERENLPASARLELVNNDEVIVYRAVRMLSRVRRAA